MIKKIKPRINKTRYNCSVKSLNSVLKSLALVYSSKIIKIDNILVGKAVITAEISLFFFKKKAANDVKIAVIIIPIRKPLRAIFIKL